MLDNLLSSLAEFLEVQLFGKTILVVNPKSSGFSWPTHSESQDSEEKPWKNLSEEAAMQGCG